MKTIFLLGLLLLSLESRAQLQIDVQFSPISNFLHQLDCVSGFSAQCSIENYKKIWNQKILLNPEDLKDLQVWAELRNRYETKLTVGSNENSKEISGEEKVTIAGLQSHSTKDYLQRLDLIMDPKDKVTAEKVVNRLYPKFEAWWKSDAASKGGAFARQASGLLKGSVIQTKINQFYAFYESELPKGYVLLFNFFFRPTEIEEATRGQQIENYSMTEFLANEAPKERIDVVLHELCHFFYRMAKTEKFESLKQKFVNLKRPTGVPAYNLLNEGLATAFGNGMISRITMSKSRWDKYFSKAKSFYFNEEIDLAGKALVPWLDKWIADGKTIYDPKFPDEYVRLMETTFGSKLTAPRMLLKETVFVLDTKITPTLWKEVRSKFKSSSIFITEDELKETKSFEEYSKYSNLNALILIHPDKLKLLEKYGILASAQALQLRDGLKLSKSALYSYEKSLSTRGYILVADTKEEATRLLDILAKQEVAFDGLLAH